MRRSNLFLLAAAALCQNVVLAAQTSTPAATTAEVKLTKAERAEVLKGLKAVVAKEYVDQKLRSILVAGLTKGEREGRYTAEEPKAFAEQVSKDLNAISRDGHLGLYFSPAFFERLRDPPKDNAQRGTDASLPANARRANYGIREMRVYPGNVRYLHLDSFGRWTGEESVKAYDHAMKFLADGDAVIVDMRGNGGGSAEAYSYFESYFVEPNLPLYTSVLRGVKGDEVRAVEKLPSPRLVGKPLWVLSDAKVASATEAFLYDVRHRNLGVIVGQKSAGAANHNEYFPLSRGFIASVSIGGPVMAATGGNWEKQGVVPHVETPPELALQTALLLATERLASTASADLKPLAEKEVLKLRGELEKAKAAHAEKQKTS
jgi:hypothetical protein